MPIEDESYGIPCEVLREIGILKELVHENVVRLLDVVISERKLWLIFEHLEMNLKEMITRIPRD